jgi:polyferredoxin
MNRIPISRQRPHSRAQSKGRSARRIGFWPLSVVLFAAFLLGGWPGQAHEMDNLAARSSLQAAPQATPQSGQEAMPSDLKMDDMPGMDMEHDHGDDMQMPGMDMDHGEAGHEHMTMPTPDAGLVRILVVLTALIAVAMLFAGRQSLRKSDGESSAPRTNLLALPVVGRFLRSRYFLGALITPTMLIFGFIVFVGLFGEQTTANPAVLLTWILWWPAVIFTFFLLGRIWCAFCPFGYLGDLAQKLFSMQRKAPAILRNMWWRLGLFLALTWITTLWALDRWPQGTALLAVGLTLGAVTLAFVYEKRVFCRYVCPVGGVFGLYSMTAPLRLTVKDGHVCQHECDQKNCFQACPWFQFPPTMERGAECSLCLDCVRACPHDNIALEKQPFASDLIHFQPHRKSFDEFAAIAAVLGVALLQTVVMLSGWSGWEMRIGSWLDLAPGRLLYTIIFLSVGVIAPLLLLALVVWSSKSFSGVRTDFFRSLRTYAYSFLPLGLALHAAHNFHHLFGEGGAMWVGLKKALAQYTGWSSLAAGASAASVSPNTLFVLQWVALLAGLYLAFRVGFALTRRDSPLPAQRFRAVLPILLFATAYTLLNLVILSASMAHRH